MNTSTLYLSLFPASSSARVATNVVIAEDMRAAKMSQFRNNIARRSIGVRAGRSEACQAWPSILLLLEYCLRWALVRISQCVRCDIPGSEITLCNVPNFSRGDGDKFNLKIFGSYKSKNLEILEVVLSGRLVRKTR